MAEMDLEQRLEREPPLPVPASPAASSAWPRASVLALQRSAGNAAVSAAMSRGPRAVARVERRCPCGGIVPPGQQECDECRRKRLAGDAAVSGELARIALARAVLQRQEVCAAVPGQVSAAAVSMATPAASSLQADATYALALSPGFVSSGYTVPEGLLATEALQSQGIATAEGLLATESVPVATTTVVEGATLADSLAAAGEGLLVLEAGGAGEVEAATGPPGWIVGAVVLVAAGGLLLTAYLISPTKPAPVAQPPASPDVRALLDPSPLTATAAPMTAARPRPVMPTGLTAAEQALWQQCADLHDTYKNTQDEAAAISMQMDPLRLKLMNNSATAQERLDFCHLLDQLLRVLERLDRERREYVTDGCDQFDWFNQGATRADREAAHMGELANLQRQIRNLYELKRRLCP